MDKAEEDYNRTVDFIWALRHILNINYDAWHIQINDIYELMIYMN